MKQFRFFFWTVVLYMLCCACVVSWNIHHWLTSPQADYLTLGALFLMALTLMSPMSMVKHTGGPLLIQRFFMATSVAAWTFFLFAFSMQSFSSRLGTYIPINRYSNQIGIVLMVVVMTGIVLFVIACFLVKLRPLRWGFRIQAVLAVLWAALIVVCITKNASTEHAAGWMYLLLLFNLLVPAPLLWMNYRLWRNAPAGHDIVAAVAALGAEQAVR
jgi:hypothetical protein